MMENKSRHKSLFEAETEIVKSAMEAMMKMTASDSFMTEEELGKKSWDDAEKELIAKFESWTKEDLVYVLAQHNKSVIKQTLLMQVFGKR